MVRFIYSKQRLQPEEPRRAHISGTELSVGCLGVYAMFQRGKLREIHPKPDAVYWRLIKTSDKNQISFDI